MKDVVGVENSGTPSVGGRSQTAVRRAYIVEQLETREFVSVQEIADVFDVTEMSVRRDFSAMSAEGVITRVRGGATRPQERMLSAHYAESSARNSAEKLRVGRRAALLLNDVGAVSFFSGSTVARVAANLDPTRRSSVTIVTNALPIIEEASCWADAHLVAIGGTYLAAYMAFVGPQAVAALEGINTDVTVIGCDGLTADCGLTTPHQLVAEIGTTLVRQASRTIVVADHGKVGRRGLTQICPISDVDVLVTDAGVDTDELNRLRESGVEIIVV